MSPLNSWIICGHSVAIVIWRALKRMNGRRPKMQNHTLQLEFCQLACNADNQWFIFDKPVNFHWSAFLEATWFSQQTALQFAMLEVVALYNCGRWRGCRRWKCTNWLERVYKWSGNGKYLSTPMPSNSPEVITGVSVYSVHCRLSFQSAASISVAFSYSRGLTWSKNRCLCTVYT